MTKFSEAKDPTELSQTGHDIRPEGDFEDSEQHKHISVNPPDEESDLSASHPASDADGELASSQITNRVPKDQANELTEHQKAINYIL